MDNVFHGAQFLVVRNFVDDTLCYKHLIMISQINLFSMSQFEAAGKELLEWCGDARAYTSHFENNLMQCLQVVNNVTRTGTVSPDLGRLSNMLLPFYYHFVIRLLHCLSVFMNPR